METDTMAAVEERALPPEQLPPSQDYARPPRKSRPVDFFRGFFAFGYFRAIEKYVPVGGRVLDFGCAAGEEWLGRRFRVTGLDISDEHMTTCRNRYADAVVGDIANTPFTAGTFDAVVSKFVLEHLPDETATAAMAEVARLLKPGGHFLSLCDLECDHPQLAWVRRSYPDVYKRLYIDDPGHWGLRRSEAWNSLISGAGLRVVHWRETSRFPLLDHHPLGQLSKAPELPTWARLSGSTALQAASVLTIARIWTLATPLVEGTIGRVLPRSWSYRLLFSAQKTQENALR